MNIQSVIVLLLLLVAVVLAIRKLRRGGCKSCHCDDTSQCGGCPLSRR